MGQLTDDPVQYRLLEDDSVWWDWKSIWASSTLVTTRCRADRTGHEPGTAHSNRSALDDEEHVANQRVDTILG